MLYVQAPDEFLGSGFRIFLAGGITGVEEWQMRVAQKLRDLDVIVLNPRRASFNANDPAAAPAQIAWEYAALQSSDLTLFWFPDCDPAVTVQPIALYELGYALGQGRPLVLGASPGYPRRLDIVEQVRNHATQHVVSVYDSLGETVAAAYDVVRRSSGNGSGPVSHAR